MRRLALALLCVLALSGCDGGGAGDCSDLVIRYVERVEVEINGARNRAGLDRTVIDPADRQGWLDWARLSGNDDMRVSELADAVQVDLTLGYGLSEQEARPPAVEIASAAKNVDDCLDRQ